MGYEAVGKGAGVLYGQRICYSFQLKPAPFRWDIKFVSASDEGLDKNLIRARIGKEKTAIKKLEPLLRKIKTMSQMRRFIFFEHAAYACGKKTRKLRGKIVQTY